MAERKLDCCVVRDLLPAYIETLTEPETTAQVREHLGDCPDCRGVEAHMRAQVPVEQAPKRALNFLKRVKRTRLLAAALSVLVALWCMWWLYDQEFHYPNTEAGRLAAVSDYVPSPLSGTMANGVGEGTPMRVAAYRAQGDRLFLFYAADNRDNVHGILHLVRGVNGKYRPVNASEAPFPYTAGIYGESLWIKDMDWEPIVLAGDNCREIYAAEVEFSVMEAGAERHYTVERTYPVSEPSFLWLLDQEELKQELGLEGKELIRLSVSGVRLLDREGSDVTDQYRDGSVTQSWGGGKSTAEMGLLYVYMGIVAVLGIVMVRYFLRRD